MARLNTEIAKIDFARLEAIEKSIKLQQVVEQQKIEIMALEQEVDNLHSYIRQYLESPESL